MIQRNIGRGAKLETKWYRAVTVRSLDGGDEKQEIQFREAV